MAEVWCRPIFLSDYTTNCGELLDAARINRITARISVVAPWTSRTMAGYVPYHVYHGCVQRYKDTPAESEKNPENLK